MCVSHAPDRVVRLPQSLTSPLASVTRDRLIGRHASKHTHRHTGPPGLGSLTIILVSSVFECYKN